MFLFFFLLLIAPRAYAYKFSGLMEQPLTSLLKEDYRQASDECEMLGYGHLSNQQKAELAHIKGLCLMNLGSPEEARGMFRESLESAKKELVTENHIAIADSYYREYDYNNALQIYKQLLGDPEAENYKAMLCYKLAKSYQKRGEWENADFYFAKLKKEFPENLENELARISTEGGNFFRIQVGSFANEENARGLTDDLLSKGYDAYLVPVTANGRELYRVRVGSYVSREAADQVEEKLRTQEHLPTYIFP